MKVNKSAPLKVSETDVVVTKFSKFLFANFG